MATTLHQQVVIRAGDEKLTAELTIPPAAEVIIIFARAGSDGHLNQRDKVVAGSFQKAGFGTFLSDLMSETDVLGSREFDIDLLTARLLIVTRWLQRRDLFKHYRLAYFGVSVAAAAAIKAAVCLEDSIGAVVCRAGRTDLALDVIPELQAPTMLIVGSLDVPVLHLNRDALESLSCVKRLEIVQGASHLFADEKIGEVATLAEGWFRKHLQQHVS